MTYDEAWIIAENICKRVEREHEPMINIADLEAEGGDLRAMIAEALLEASKNED